MYGYGLSFLRYRITIDFKIIDRSDYKCTVGKYNDDEYQDFIRSEDANHWVFYGSEDGILDLDISTADVEETTSSYSSVDLRTQPKWILT